MEPINVNDLRPFNLSEALAGNPVVTRHGLPVTEVQYFKSVRSGFPVAAVIDGNLHHANTKGQSKYGWTDYDLFMVPPPPITLHKWVNVYQTGFSEYEFGALHDSYEKAFTNPWRSNRVGIAHVVWSADKPYPEELPDES